jgi:sugar phosphate isomerase/epimerase
LTSRYGISTHLFQGERLGREHLVEVAAHGFDAVELYATRTHFDYHDPAAVRALAEWLDDTRLALHSVHAPTAGSFQNGRWGGALSLADADEHRRGQAVAEALAVLDLAAVVPFSCLVVHLGVPSADSDANSRPAAARSLEALGTAAAAAGVTLALELIPNDLSAAARLVRWLEDDLELARAGVCLDAGHAHLAGDVMDAVETCSGHIVTTHVHDNRGARDEHLVPGRGTIDWPGVLMAFQKVGYDGAWMFELAPAADAQAVLQAAAGARDRFERLLRWDDDD